jgi:hypothetical protein
MQLRYSELRGLARDRAAEAAALPVRQHLQNRYRTTSYTAPSSASMVDGTLARLHRLAVSAFT